MSDHLGGAWDQIDPYTYWPDIWQELIDEYGIKSVIDLGCGYGHNLKWFYDKGIECLGVEGWKEAVDNNVCPKEIIVQHDFIGGPYIPRHQFDLCIATEFVEHVEQRFEDSWLCTAGCCDYFLMCHATPGQGGWHHVNEQPSDYWVNRLERLGWTLDKFWTDKIRATGWFTEGYWNGHAHPWGRPTALFFINDSVVR